MKRIRNALCALILIAPSVHAQSSWMDRCKIYLAQTLVSAYPTILEMAALQLAQQGDPYAAELLRTIQHQKPARQIACEIGSDSISGILSQVVKSLGASGSVQSAIKSALSAATYSVLHESVRWMF